MPRRHPKWRGAFVLIVAAWWILGLLGLDGGRLSSFQTVAIGCVALLVHWIAGSQRRRAELARERIARGPVVTPRTCVVLRRFGEDGDHAPSSAN